MTEHEETTSEAASVSVHPTMGELSHLKRARAEYDASTAAARGAGAITSTPPSSPDVLVLDDHDDVVAAPTCGSLTELRFAHHAHCCEGTNLHEAHEDRAHEPVCCCCD